ncbi:MAG: Mrp/NBP35 family ATP-binding protein [Candidatus Symbiothrix sp.]|jgi:ATP-binding protein involved in chromosome partitioning|nr:Mrp/NBP35 family ATP-binding protein [Candidatus Symbiothrix sp.]
MKLSPESILEALSKVRYPGNGKNLVEAGMIAGDWQIEGRKVVFSIVFDKPNDPFIKSVIKAAETAILTFVDPEIEIKGNIRALTTPVPPPEPKNLLPEVKNIIAVASGKGGVGKSTVSVNLAVALAQLGYRVGLLDADIFGPSIPKMFGEEDAHPYSENIDGRNWIIPIEKYGVKILSIGFFVAKGSAVAWRGSMAGNALKQLISDTNWGELDYFILDLPPGTSDIQLSLIQFLSLTGAIIVTTPQEVALADARKGIDLFRNEKVKVPILGLVENMAWFTPAELPENKYYIFGKDGGKRLAEELGIPLLGEIPMVQGICESGDSGLPVALSEDSLMKPAFRGLAERLVKSSYKNGAM